MEHLLMSLKERTRMGVMKQVKAKLLSTVAAGELLRLGYPATTAYRGLKIGCDGKSHMAGTVITGENGANRSYPVRFRQKEGTAAGARNEPEDSMKTD